MRKPLFRRKQHTRKDKNVYLPFKKKEGKDIVKRKRVFRLPNLKNSRIRLPKISIYAILVVIFLGLSYISVVYINKLRDGDENSKYIEQYVIGLENIPTFPYSEFIFKNSLDEDAVKNFISAGNSAYRLPKDSDIQDVFDYYSEKLPPLGWTFVQSVALGTEDKEYGNYWTKDSVGLRIYSKYNDVWYETITKDEAISGLSQRVQSEVERDLMLATSEYEDLLPDFPWVLQVPKEYVISYGVSAFENMKMVTLSKLGSSEKLNLLPIGYTGAKVIDYFLDDYVEQLSIQTDQTWGVTNSYVIITNTGSGLRGIIECGTEEREVVVMPNTFNNVMYILDTTIEGSAFFDYVLENIKTQKID